ncbi:aliphatic sulfonate ABC transporter substrate-binding protein [Sporolactobacillus shoreae]|uniref:Aliphatic sulfonate ABC transporter substrate-binding protein n=1 Tax=Sporolactobacillus shoreae TaxID=1465501 RepID=A0A4Z0GPW2_9BACL|nr:ABC transporter substrate-binding protein [Sporolactobacillus shoreae]TGA98308.1 aliphatic sulfonate ABC transporter substrate-binding protein [Sporolactobacillus shoreae]
MGKKLKLFAILLLTMALVLGGCSSNKSQGSSGSSASKKIVLGFNPWPGYFPWYIAQEKGFFKKYGLDVQLKQFSALSGMLNALSSGQLDAAGVTINDMIVPLSKGVDLKAVGVYDISNGGDAFVVNKNIKSFNDLKGKRVATELGTVDHLLMLEGMKKAGLKESDVQFSNMDISDAGNALISGKLDGASLYEPFISKATSSGKAKVLFSSADMPGLITDVIAVKGSLAKSDPKDVENLLRAWYDALDYWHKHPDESMKIMAKAANTPVNEYKDVYKTIKIYNLDESINAFKKANDYSSLYYTGQETAKFLKGQQMITGNPDLNKALDVQFLKKLQAGK